MRFSLHVSSFFALSFFSIILFFFSGCTKTNAFSRFHFNLEKEHATSSLRTSKIYFENNVTGVVSSIYLNEVRPKQYHGMEYFLIAVYTKEQATLDDPNSQNRSQLVLKLADANAVKIKKLENIKQFEGFMPLDNNWNSYYLVAFAPSQSDMLSLTLQDAQATCLPLIYQKNEQ